nr:hypothetical protein [Tanacetum cinerariifolium]
EPKRWLPLSGRWPSSSAVPRRTPTNGRVKLLSRYRVAAAAGLRAAAWPVGA